MISRTLISMRVPTAALDRIDSAARRNRMSRTEFMIAASLLGIDANATTEALSDARRRIADLERTLMDVRLAVKR